MNGKSNIVYGRLSEATHIAGYTFERAMGELKWLLDENRWKEVGEGFDDIHDFIQSISFAEFKIAIEQRKEIAKMLTDIGASQRATAKVLGVTQPTIREDLGLTERNLSTKEKLISDFQGDKNNNERNLSPEDTSSKSWFEKEGQKVAEREQRTVHVSQNSGENEWYTPEYIIESARVAMGSIDLDPATSELANEIVRAEQIFTESDNGLKQEWSGNIWLNPPYSQPLISEFSDKLISELPNINQACVLVNNATETNWFQNMMRGCNAICFLKGRVKYLDYTGSPANTPLQGQAILYFGKNKEEFFNNFYVLGICLTTMKRK